MKKQKNQTWIKPRHRHYWNFVNFLLAPVIKHKYHMELVPFDDCKGQYLILSNHQTPFDQFFISRLFKGKVYYVCTEDLLSNQAISGILKHCVAPIPIQKGAMDIATIKACAKVAKEGGSIAMYPEGNRTYSGKTGYIKPSVAKLAKFLKLPIAFVIQKGGYGLEPRWSDVVRKGKGRVFVQSVLAYEQYSQMSDDELYQCICQNLYWDDTVAPPLDIVQKQQTRRIH